VTALTPSNVLGARLGVYEVQAPIGSGGMASVYRGFDHNLQRPVAIKVLSELAASQTGFVERFRQEARLIARLRHPHIVHVYDFGVQDQVVYMVQELLPGPTLEQRLAELTARGQPMPRMEVMAVVRQLAEALDAAHAAGIIHRDVKPSNALWNAAGALVLTDFGIAKSTIGETTQTQAGVVMGTPAYVSPEQARGESLTPASDIYALGVVLYQLIGGRPPFDGNTPLGVVLQHLQEPPPPLQPLRANLPPEVEAVVQRALAKRPADRFASAGELARAIEAAWPGRQPAQQPAADIHALPTTAWQPLTPPATPAPAAQHAALSTSGSDTQHPALSTQHSAPSTQHSALTSRALPILAALLTILLVGGALLAAQGATESGARPAPTSAAQSTPAAEPTDAGAPEATEAPEPAGPLKGLRTLFEDPLVAGAERDAILASVNSAELALASGDSAGATAALTALQQQLVRAGRAGSVPPETVRAALAEVQSAAEASGLRLPLSVGP
jgi:serine/threonine-protein kinase